jgi:hypothetical protein
VAPLPPLLLLLLLLLAPLHEPLAARCRLMSLHVQVAQCHDSAWMIPASERRLLQAVQYACNCAVVQEVAPSCFSLLHTIADVLSEWSAAVSRAVEQLQLSDDKQLCCQLVEKASDLHLSGIWLPAAACDLLRCMREQFLYWAVDKRQLLNTLGQLTQQVLI